MLIFAPSKPIKTKAYREIVTSSKRNNRWIKQPV